MTSTQDKKPHIQEDLERVGITGLRTLVITKWGGKEHRFIPEIEIVIDLDKERKGAHMSRLIESITELVEEEVAVEYNSIEELERHILESLKSRHSYKRGEVSMRTQLVVKKKTPVTNKKTMETHDVVVKLRNENDKYMKILEVEVLGNTVCPHAMRSGRTHIQRAVGILEIKTDYDNMIELEEMIDCVEESFSSEIYTLLKTDDELYVVNKMFDNPKFVEDVTREILHNAKNRFKNCDITVKTISQESIHRHDVIAEGFLKN